jgi:hypothetical protein
MGIYVKTDNGTSNVMTSRYTAGTIEYVGYHVLTYQSSTWLQTTIPKGTMRSDAFLTDRTITVNITPQFYEGMPYWQIKGYGYLVTRATETITLYAIGSGFVSGHLQGLSVIVTTNHTE